MTDPVTDVSLAAFVDELQLRMEAIQRLARVLANPACECEGEGVDWEGDEWTLCPSCVMVGVRAHEAGL